MMKNIDHSSFSGQSGNSKTMISDIKIPEIKIPPIQVPEAQIHLTVQPSPVKVEPIVTEHNVVVNPKLTIDWNKIYVLICLVTTLNFICAILLKIIK